MKKLFVALSCLIVMAAAAACQNADPRAKYGPVLQNERLLVGATYYTWHPSNFRQGYLRAFLDPPQEPLLGQYRSDDVKAVEEQIAWCSRHGVDFLAVSWWPKRPQQNAIIDQAFVHAANLQDIRFCIFYETWSVGWRKEYSATVFDKEASDFFIADVLAIADKYFDNPAYLRVNGRPVLFLYLTRTFAGDYAQALATLRQKLLAKGHDVYLIADEIYWSVMSTDQDRQPRPYLVPEPQPERIALFDAITTYNPYLSVRHDHGGYGAKSTFVADVAGLFRRYYDLRGPKVNFVPNILPGYNDRGCRRALRQFIIPRQWDQGAPEGSFLAENFDRLAMPFLDPRLNMLLITSFNEWNEDTALEPTKPAPATSRDLSPSGREYTDGFSYAGYGFAMLETLRDKACAAHGRVLDNQGRPVWRATVFAAQGGKTMASDQTDRQGYYTLSRLNMPPGVYDVGVADGPGRRVTVDGQRAAKLDLRLP